MRKKKSGLHRSEPQFFYGELTSTWKDRGLENQAYILVKHINFSFEDVKGLTLLERMDYIKLYNEERQREKEEIDKVKSRNR
jgi:hypothetical protein